jgi:hypothetical protein
MAGQGRGRGPRFRGVCQHWILVHHLLDAQIGKFRAATAVGEGGEQRGKIADSTTRSSEQVAIGFTGR